MVRLFDSRGQAHALEAFTAALLLLAGLLFAMQATAVTPLSASTSNQHLENQQRKMASDMLGSMDDSGILEDAVLNWSDGGFGEKTDSSVPQYYTNPDNITAFGDFGDTLNRTFLAEGTAMNVYVNYRTESQGSETETMVFMGTPSDNAVVATRTVILVDSDRLTESGDRLTNSSYFAPDAAPGDPLYNVVEVRIVLWQN